MGIKPPVGSISMPVSRAIARLAPAVAEIPQRVQAGAPGCEGGAFQAVVRLPENKAGRDFVVGDIHGAYDLVWAAMRAVQFDRRVDRLLSVGDLIDRGSGSHRCLEFLAQDYVYAVRGNHEDDFHQEDGEILQALGRMNFNGLRWVNQTPGAKLEAIARRFAQLPYAIEVPTPRGLVGLVHADVPPNMDWPTFAANLRSGHEKTIACALMGRRRFKQGDTSGVVGVGRVFVGHSITDSGPRQLGNIYAVDTGAFLAVREGDRSPEPSASLTIASLVCHTGALVGRQLQPDAPLRVCLDEVAPAAAFGSYASVPTDLAINRERGDRCA